MKYPFVKLLGSGILVSSLLFAACKSDDSDGGIAIEDSNILPSAFRVDIPDAISHSSTTSNQRLADNEIINGAVIYEHIANFIHVGEVSAEVIESIISTIYTYNLAQTISFDYISTDDGRTKTVNVIENVTRDGVEWEYEMTIKDSDGSQALQLVWNNAPVKGIAILSVYDLNRTEDEEKADARYQVEYDESGTNGYDAEMTVSLAGLSEEDYGKNWANSLKMFAGKKDDIVEVFGNSNHPDFYWVYPEWAGRNYGFRARADQSLEIGVAEAGIPFSTQTVADSIFHYDLQQIAFDITRANTDYSSLSDDSLMYYVDLAVINEDAPAFFYEDVYQVSGIDNMPTDKGFTSEFSTLTDLNPYVPAEIADLEVDFIE